MKKIIVLLLLIVLVKSCTCQAQEKNIHVTIVENFYPDTSLIFKRERGRHCFNTGCQNNPCIILSYDAPPCCTIDHSIVDTIGYLISYKKDSLSSVHYNIDADSILTIHSKWYYIIGWRKEYFKNK